MNYKNARTNIEFQRRGQGLIIFVLKVKVIPQGIHRWNCKFRYYVVTN